LCFHSNKLNEQTEHVKRKFNLFLLFAKSAKQPTPAGFSRVVIRLAGTKKAKPNANTRKLSPDKCLVVKSLASSLRPVRPSQHGIQRHHHQKV
jgi:hypothetical protein